MAAFLRGRRMIRIGTVTNVYHDTGKVKVLYEDTESTSLPLPMISMNREQSMPKVGDRVITLHLLNGSSKGFCIGTYFDDEYKGNEKYKKEFDDKAFAECDKGKYKVKGENIALEGKEVNLKCDEGDIKLSELLKKLKDYEKRIKFLESKV